MRHTHDHGHILGNGSVDRHTHAHDHVDGHEHIYVNEHDHTNANADIIGDANANQHADTAHIDAKRHADRRTDGYPDFHEYADAIRASAVKFTTG